MAQKDEPVIEQMRVLSTQYPRYGYRRIQVFMQRAGESLSADRTYRLWAKAGLQVPRKRPRRHVASTRPRTLTSTMANQVLAYDFEFDACANGQQLKCLTVVDEYTRECLAIEVAGSIRSNRVIDVLSLLISVRGAPQTLRSDNGPEFVSRALLRWALRNDLSMSLIDPWQKGTAESFNGKFRDECLSMEWFRVRQEAKAVIESWREHYNHVRPHSSLSNMTPIEFGKKCNSKIKKGAVVQF